MTDTPTNNSSPSTSSAIGVPAAIVIAGALIALAVYFGGNRPATTTTTTGTGAQPTAVANQGTGTAPAVGEFRPVSDDDHIRGAADAKVTIVEYSDIECPFCRQFHPTVQQIVDEYPDDVRWVYRHFPLESIHPNARIAANAVECAADQDRFWELTDYLFENVTTGSQLAESQLSTHAEAAGVPNLNAFESCLTARTHDDEVSADLEDAQAAGGRGTPYTILIGPDGQQVPISGAQPYASVKAQVDALL